MYLFCDLETPGLDPELGILEIAWTLTYDDYRPIMQEVRSLMLNGEHVAALPDWEEAAADIHDKSGFLALWDTAVNDKVSLEYAESSILHDIDIAMNYVPEPVVLAGQSPQGVDRPFIKRWMPSLDRRLGYRHHDIRTLISFWESLGVNHGVPDNPAMHRAAADVQWSLSVARAYHRSMERNFQYLEDQGERFGLE